MKIRILIFALVLSPIVLVAQWIDSGSSITTSDNVGIGISFPDEKLSVIGNIFSGSNSSTSYYEVGVKRTVNSNLYHSKVLVGGGSGEGIFMSSNKTSGISSGIYIKPDLGEFLFYNSNFTNNVLIRVNGISYFNGGNVGIGTTSPSYRLDLSAGNSNTHARFIGTYSGIQGIQVERSGGANVRLVANYTNYGGGLESSSALRFAVNNNGIDNPSIYIKTDGNVGIGETNPTKKLVVNGVIGATEVRVSTTPNSDYVFEPDYNLLSLKEVESFIQQNKHLPDIPSAEEFKENGVGLGEMDDMLLRKVEELTLYVIEMKKEIARLKILVENEYKDEK